MSDWRPAASRERLVLRAQVLRTIRAFFEARGVLEIETPILAAAGNPDPNIEALVLEWPAPPPRRRWLRTSPEFALKRLLAAGIGDCYELGPVFRAGEYGRRHNPEFTMLEWYRLGFDHRRLAAEVVELVQSTRVAIGSPPIPVEFVDYDALYRREAGVDPSAAADAALAAALAPFDVRATDLSRDDLLDLILTHCIEPRLAQREALTVITDFPASQCALARIQPGPPPRAARFEVYFGGLELANGYHELADPSEQRQRFAADLARRRARGLPEPAIDDRLLDALMHGLPDCAGVALGVDRLLMGLAGADAIAEVLAFPAERA